MKKKKNAVLAWVQQKDFKNELKNIPQPIAKKKKWKYTEIKT